MLEFLAITGLTGLLILACLPLVNLVGSTVCGWIEARQGR